MDHTIQIIILELKGGHERDHVHQRPLVRNSSRFARLKHNSVPGWTIPVS